MNNYQHYMDNNQHFLDLGRKLGKQQFNPYWAFTGFCIGFMTAMLLTIWVK